MHSDRHQGWPGSRGPRIALVLSLAVGGATHGGVNGISLRHHHRLPGKAPVLLETPCLILRQDLFVPMVSDRKTIERLVPDKREQRSQ